MLSLKADSGNFQSLIKNSFSEFWDAVVFYVHISTKTIKTNCWTTNIMKHDLIAESRKTEKFLLCRGNWKSAESLWRRIKNCSILARGNLTIWKIITTVWKSGKKNLPEYFRCYSNLNSNRKSCHSVSDSIQTK